MKVTESKVPATLIRLYRSVAAEVVVRTTPIALSEPDVIPEIVPNASELPSSDDCCTLSVTFDPVRANTLNTA